MRIALITLLLAGSVSGSLAAQNAPARVIRSLDAGPAGRIALGEPLRAAALFTQVKPGVYELKPAEGATSHIMVLVDSTHAVRAMAIVYRRGKDFAAARSAYERQLGTPKEVDEIEDGGTVKGASWQDAHTYFAIVQRHFPDSLPDVAAFLHDW